jgi:molybdopterin-guanine dinucleotide biosynthesis protein A
MKRAAAILAGGESSRLSNKPLVLLAGKPMILNTIRRCEKMVDELLVVVNSSEQSEALSRILSEEGKLRVAIDRKENFSSPLLGARTAFENSTSELTLLLPCDAPLVKESVLELLFATIDEWDSVIPRYPTGHIEPLFAVYRTGAGLEAASAAILAGKRSMRDLIMRLNTIYLSTDAIKEIDPLLESFTNVNTPEALKRVEQKLIRNTS